MSETGGLLPALRDGAGGAVEPVRVLARIRPEGPAEEAELHEASLGSREATCGPLRIRLAVETAGDHATWRLSVRNAGAATVELDAVGLGLRWLPAPGTDSGGWRLLRQGFQSWSFAGGVPLDDAGTPPFPSGSWLRGFHHAHFAPPADRSGWHESDGAVVAGGAPDGPCCLAGVLESGRAFGTAFVRREGGALRVELEQRLERPLAPGASCELEPMRVALGGSASALLEGFAEAQGRFARARRFAPFQAGWCSWYHFFHDVTEASFLRNLEALARAREDVPIALVQLDDGYQRAVGDWLETNRKFPSGLPALAHAVRDAGFTAGLWTAPFCVVPESRLSSAHPDWLLRDRGPEGAPLRGLHHGVWAKDGWVHVLDPTHPAVAVHLERVYRELYQMGFTYLKLDFLYTASLRARARDANATRAERLRRGLEAIRAGAGEHAFLLGCGCPLGPAVGLVDGMRIGPDTAPHWAPLPIARIPGLEATVPAGRNALRNTLARAWMHRRLWLNDPDCLLTRRDSRLDRQEVRALAISIAVTGGMAILSDDLPGLGPEERELARETLALAREVDESAQAGAARALDVTGDEMPRAVTARAFGDRLLALFNPDDAPARCTVSRAAVSAAAPGRLADAPAEPLLGSPPADEADGRITVELPRHGAALYRLRGAPELVVFCDYDGTFAVQDVGSTLARRHAAARRAELWPRLERGELTAWQYNLELLDGLRLPEAELEAFLRTVELDPGARDLVAWCEARGIPFRVLSDGFDRNLDRLQELHGIRFAYDANHLHYEHGAWRIAAGHPSDGGCDCGTGVCKRQRIEHFRRRHPGVPVVHIGNGRVSDRCAAAAADIVFAKDTLAEELDARGIGYERFATLHDVIARLEARLAGG